VQPTYLYNNTFDECLERLIKFGDTIQKPMKTWYDFNTRTVRIISDLKIGIIIEMITKCIVNDVLSWKLD